MCGNQSVSHAVVYMVTDSLPAQIKHRVTHVHCRHGSQRHQVRKHSHGTKPKGQKRQALYKGKISTRLILVITAQPTCSLNSLYVQGNN